MKRNNNLIYQSLDILDEIKNTLNIEVDENNIYKDLLRKVKDLINTQSKTIELNEKLRKEIEKFISDINIKNLNKKIIDILYTDNREKNNLYEEDIKGVKLSDLNDKNLMKLLCKICSGINYFQRDEMLLLKYNKSIWYIGWNEYYMACRGKIININNRKLITYPFDKFFNLNEMEETRIERIENLLENAKYISLTEKMDGSIISISKYGDEIIVSSNGGFNNEPIHMANKILDKEHKYFKNNIKEGFTYIFEVIYPSGKRVVDYGLDEKLVLLSIREFNSERLLTYNECKQIALELKLELVEAIEFTSLDNLIQQAKNLSDANKEGWVLRIMTDEEDILVKIKLEEYTKLHKILLSEINPFDVYDLLRRDKLDDVIANMDDEGKEKVLNIVNTIFLVLNKIEKNIREGIEETAKLFNLNKEEFKTISKDKNHPKYNTKIELLKYINSKYKSTYTVTGIIKYYAEEMDVDGIIKNIDKNVFKRICDKEKIKFDK